MKALLIALCFAAPALAEIVVNCACGCIVYREVSTGKTLGLGTCGEHESTLKKMVTRERQIVLLSLIRPADFTTSTAYVNAYIEWKGRTPRTTTDYK